jgi:hypothetical protein
MYIAAKVVKKSNVDKVKYSILAARTPAMRCQNAGNDALLNNFRKGAIKDTTMGRR